MYYMMNKSRDCLSDVEAINLPMQVTSHGFKVFRDVLLAPPLDSPLCCLTLRSMLGVDPM
jgi:hypothetical protein